MDHIERIVRPAAVGPGPVSEGIGAPPPAMSFRASYYFIRLLSSGLDDSRDHETLEEAIRAARVRIKGAGYSAHAVITEGAALRATVLYSKGRIYTKKAKQS